MGGLNLDLLPDKPKEKYPMRSGIDTTIDDVVDEHWDGDEDFKKLLKETAAHEAMYGSMDSENPMQIDPIQEEDMKRFSPQLGHMGVFGEEDGTYNSKKDLRTNVISSAMKYLTNKGFENVPKTQKERADLWKNIYNTKLGKGTPEKFLKSLEEFGMREEDPEDPATSAVRPQSSRPKLNLDLLPDKPKAGLNLDLLPDKPHTGPSLRAARPTDASLTPEAQEEFDVEMGRKRDIALVKEFPINYYTGVPAVAEAFMDGMLDIRPKELQRPGVGDAYPLSKAIGSLAGLIGTGYMTGGIAPGVSGMKALKDAPTIARMVGGRMAQSGTTFGIREGAEQMINLSTKSSDKNLAGALGETAKAIAFGAGLGATNSIPTALIRIPAEMAYGFTTSKLEGASNESAGLSAAMFGIFGMFNRANLSNEYKISAYMGARKAIVDRFISKGIGVERSEAMAEQFLMRVIVQNKGKLTAGNFDKIRGIVKSSLKHIRTNAYTTPQGQGVGKDMIAYEATLKANFPKASVPRQFENPQGHDVLNYLNRYLPDNVVAGMGGEARLNLANGPVSVLRDMALEHKIIPPEVEPTIFEETPVPDVYDPEKDLGEYQSWLEAISPTTRPELDVPLHPAPKMSIDMTVKEPEDIQTNEEYQAWLKSKEITQRTELDVPLHPAPKVSIDMTKKMFKLMPEEQDLLNYMRTMVDIGEPGMRVRTEDFVGEEQWSGIASGYPKWFQNKGYGKEQVLSIFNKANKGLPLTEKQQEIYKDLQQGSRSEFDKERDYYVEQERQELELAKQEGIEAGEIDKVAGVGAAQGKSDFDEQVPEWVTEKQPGEVEGPKAGGIMHDLSPKEKEQLKTLNPEGVKIVTLKRDIKVQAGNEVKHYKKGEDIYIYQDPRTGKAIVKDGEYGILPKKGVTQVEQAGTELKGGEWAKNLYDQRIPQELKKMGGELVEVKVGKKGLSFNEADFVDEIEKFMGVPIDEVSRRTLESKGASKELVDKFNEWFFPAMRKGKQISQPAIKITPEMRRKVIGQPMAGGKSMGMGAGRSEKGYGIIENSEKSSKEKMAKSDYSKIAEQTPTREETNIVKEFLKMSAPSRVSGATEAAGLTLRKELAELAHKDVVAIETLKKAHSAFTWMNDADAHKFIDNIENGKPQDNPKLQPFADVMRKHLDSRREAIRKLGKGQLEGYYENYFPHIWKDPKNAKDIIMQIMGKKQLQGTKSFLKKRVIVTVKDGLDRGLRLVSDNPVDLVLLKMHEMDRYLMSQNIIRDLKAKGLAKFVYAKNKVPEGYSRVNDNAFTVFMPPEMTKQEAFDSVLVDQMMDIAKSLGIDTKRFVNIGGRGRWGVAKWRPGIEGGEQVRTKFAGPESVLAHEIGHVLGYRYDLYNMLGRRKEGAQAIHQKGKKAGQEYFKPSKDAVKYRRKIDKQWRDLADERQARPAYARNQREKEAVLLQSYVSAPKVFKRVAPDLYDGFVKFLNAHGELRPILDLEPSLVLGAGEAKIKVPGFTTLGHYYVPRDVARLINNHLSPGLRNADNKLIGGAYNITRGAGNVLNQVNLALSGFHALNVSTDMMASTIGLGLRKLMTRGQAMGGLMDILMSPLAPIQGIWQGTRVKKAYRKELDSITDPKLRLMVESLIAAGGRDRMDVYYYNQQIKALTATFKDILKGTGVEKLTGIARLPFNVFGTMLETVAKPIMEWYVPTGKIGLFAKLAEHELQRAADGDMDVEHLVGQLASVWDSVDNRMGQLIYDNLFWNKVFKDSLMLAIRSVGWNLGSWREYAGSVVDLATVAGRMKKGDKILSHKMAYAIGAATVYAVFGAVIQYLLTGKAPEEPKDYFFPKTGRTNPDGSAERLSLPTYAKDIYAYSQRPFKTVKNKAHPLIGLLYEQLHNENFYNVQISDPKDPIYDQIKDKAKHIVDYAKPFSVKNYEKMERAGEGGNRTLFTSITGITSAPSYVTRSAAQKLMFRYIIDRIPDSTRTKEDFAKSEYRKSLKSRIRKGEKIDIREAVAMIGIKSFKRLEKAAKLPPFTESFKRLSIKEALNVYAISTAKEKNEARSVMIDKFRRAEKAGKVDADMRALFVEVT